MFTKLVDYSVTHVHKQCQHDEFARYRINCGEPGQPAVMATDFIEIASSIEIVRDDKLMLSVASHDATTQPKSVLFQMLTEAQKSSLYIHTTHVTTFCGFVVAMLDKGNDKVEVSISVGGNISMLTIPEEVTSTWLPEQYLIISVHRYDQPKPM